MEFEKYCIQMKNRHSVNTIDILILQQTPFKNWDTQTFENTFYLLCTKLVAKKFQYFHKYYYYINIRPIFLYNNIKVNHLLLICITVFENMWGAYFIQKYVIENISRYILLHYYTNLYNSLKDTGLKWAVLQNYFM